jgi:hypothetical protein
MRQAERILQREVMARLRHAPLAAIVVPSPNGIFIPARTQAEQTLARRVVHQLKLDGQLLPGAPDLLILWDEGCGCIELKRPQNKRLFDKQRAGTLSEAQIEFRARCDYLRINYTVCQSWAEVRDTLKAWGRLPFSWQDAETRIGRAA